MAGVKSEVSLLAVTLSILIPALPERLALLKELTEFLDRQARGLPVEILALVDNRQRSTGAKENGLVRIAKGQYVTFIDDDDWVADTYVADILQALEDNAGVDSVMFDVALYLYGTFSKTFRYGQEYMWEETEECIFREPGPLMCWSRDIMVRYPLPDLTIDEDSLWIRQGPWKFETVSQVRIPRVLYFYRAVPGHS